VGLRNTIFRAAMEALYFSGAHVLLRPLVGGVGTILTLHNVRPPRPDRFQPNRLLEVTPSFLERVIRRWRRSNVDFVSLDEMHRRMTDRDFSRRFVCVTFDDGYRDTQQFAYPILKKFEVPFAVYVATSFADRVGEMWWLALEAVIARNALVGLHMDGEDRWFDCASVEQKYEVFGYIYWWLRKRQTDEDIRQIVRDLAARNKVPITNFCDELCMTWPEIAELASDPLVTIGAHTVNHPILAKVSEQSVRSELENSRTIIGAALGKAPEHLAYPVGDPTSAAQREFRIAADLGFKTAVTTRPGVLFQEHRDHLLALPRVSLNGEFQRARYANVLASGAATGLWNGFRKLNVA
jgi:peptidoglycan/xylan/chitin deacetylase (PgdA/CDA1 family)